jgi:hypothetical protein
MRCLLRMATFSGPLKCRRVLLMGNLRWGYTNPTEEFFQFRLRQDSSGPSST